MQSTLSCQILDMFLFDGEVAMEDLFVYFIKSSTEEILLIEEDCEI